MTSADRDRAEMTLSDFAPNGHLTTCRAQEDTRRVNNIVRCGCGLMLYDLASRPVETEPISSTEQPSPDVSRGCSDEASR